jgi:hypothetical protein
MKMLECKRGGLYDIGFIDPNTIQEVTVNQFPKDTEDNLLMFLQKQQTNRKYSFLATSSECYYLIHIRFRLLDVNF